MLSVAYIATFSFALLLFDPNASALSPYGITRIFLTLAIPASLSYILWFRIRSIAQEDFEDRFWDAERQRGLRAGRDRDHDGTVETHERIKV